MGKKYKNRNNQEKNRQRRHRRNKCDNTADIYDEHFDINHADSASEEPFRITENDISDSERDMLLILREVLEGNT